MGDVVLVVVGGALVALVLVEALATTIAVSEGGGPVTAKVTGLLWRALVHVHRPDSSSAALALAGPTLVIGTVLAWVATLWAGWTLVFLGGGPTIVNAATRAPAEVADVAYYAGFTVFTLGVGDFVATTPALRVVTAVASFTGLFLITLAITYLISVVAAVVDRRALAVQIGSMGRSPGEIVAGGWATDAFASSFVQQVVAINGQIAKTAEQHMAYPVLHFFHSRTRDTAAPVALAALDDAMLILRSAVAPDARPPASVTEPTRRAVERYLRSVGAGSMSSAAVVAPPPPDLRELRAGDVPLATADDFRAALDADSERRRRMAQLVASDGWSW